jgi:hypothetical protein
VSAKRHIAAVAVSMCLFATPVAAQIVFWDSTNEPALRNFITQGCGFGGQVNLSAMAGGRGGMFSGAAAVSPGVYLYQLTQTGLAATLTVGARSSSRTPI